jgi:hypothetical protein
LMYGYIFSVCFSPCSTSSFLVVSHKYTFCHTMPSQISKKEVLFWCCLVLKDRICLAINVLVCPFHIHEWRDNFYHLFIHIHESIFARILLTTFAIIFVNDLSTIVWLRHRGPSSPPLISFCVLMEQLVHHASSVVSSPSAVILTLLDISTSSVNVSYPIVGFCLPSFYLLVFF